MGSFDYDHHLVFGLCGGARSCYFPLLHRVLSVQDHSSSSKGRIWREKQQLGRITCQKIVDSSQSQRREQHCRGSSRGRIIKYPRENGHSSKEQHLTLITDVFLCKKYIYHIIKSKCSVSVWPIFLESRCSSSSGFVVFHQWTCC